MLSLAFTNAIAMSSQDKAATILETIADTAKAKYGDRWEVGLVGAYCEIEQRETNNAAATIVNRRNQISRIFKERRATLESVCRLAQAVGIEIELVITSREIKRI